MSKRTLTPSASTNPQNYWPTPPVATLPLYRSTQFQMDMLTSRNRFVEPCAGDGRLKNVLVDKGLCCVAAIDINPRRGDIGVGDAASLIGLAPHIPVVTNPPWARKLLEPILSNLLGQTTLWLLLPLDYLSNQWTGFAIKHVNCIIPLGRVSWLENGKGGMENSAWFRFAKTPQSIVVPKQKEARL
jgi:hypothetical protein